MGEMKMRSGLRVARMVAGLLLWLLAALFGGLGQPAMAQVQVSPISDTVYYADGTTAAGTVLVSWPAFTLAGGQSVPKGSTSATLGAGGRLSVSLAPNTGATPAGTYYTVVYHLNDGSTSREYWTVPVSSGFLALSAVRTNVLPTSVAIQSVSKQYVDQAISRAALGLVPQDQSVYVLKTGDAMTGALLLPGDPVSGSQAATKSYVDTASAALAAGLSQKVSTLPVGTQTVTQPAGTQLQVNHLNGQLYVKQYQSQTGNDGIANALTSSDCANGCSAVADPGYAGNDYFSLYANRSQLTDQRGGAVDESFLNPQSPRQPQAQARTMSSFQTLSAPASRALGYNTVQASVLALHQNALAGGNNVFPQNLTGNLPYFKSTYGATNTQGYNTTVGQHVLDTHTQNCYAVGDCLLGGQFLYSSGGNRDNSDEGTHPFDIEVAEHASVFRGVCSAGCSAGSTHLQIAATAAAGTQGEGRFLINMAASKVITTGLLIGPGGGGPHASVQFSGTAFPVSTFFSLAAVALPQTNVMAPGTVNAAIVTSGVAAGFSTNTASAPAASGIACVADANAAGPDDFETVTYAVTDGTHVTLNLQKPHAAGATLAMGGLCGYGVEQTVDTIGGLRQLFPVIGSLSPTALYYSGLGTKVLGLTGATSGYANIQVNLTGLQRSGNVVTATVSGVLPQDVNGLTMTVASPGDASFSGSFAVTTTAANQFTYPQTGANSSVAGGSASVLTGSYALYPAAEVLSVYNSATRAVDGAMTLAANNVAWAAGDAVELPHFFQNRVAADTTAVVQYLPRALQPQSAGLQFKGVNSALLQGWVVDNNSSASSYYGNGGTHAVPDAAMVVRGPWSTALDLQAGDNNGIVMRCNSHGCNRWNSSYNLFTLQSSNYFDYLSYAPTSSTMTFNMRGTLYSLSPTSLTAGTINATTINATTINGLQSATASVTGGVTLGPAAVSAALANVASSGSAADVSGLARSATIDATNAANITSGVLDAARLPAGSGGGVCASSVAFSATPAFAVTCANPTFHMPLTGSVTAESFSGLAAGQRITLVFQTGATPGVTVQWSAAVHGGFLTSSTVGAAGYALANRYFVQQLVVDSDGVTLLNPGAIND